MVYPSAVARFLAGFATASVLWGGVLAVLFLFGMIAGQDEPSLDDEDELAVVEDAGVDPSPRRRRNRRRRTGRDDVVSADDSPVPTGTATTGDDLGENDPRSIDGEGTGGEAQLSNAQIEQTFDGAFGRVRRCLVLAAGDEPVTGRLTFGLRIAGSGEVTRVNLSGPAAVTTGESGDCLRTAARSMRFPSFDGPDMFVRYPVTLD